MSRCLGALLLILGLVGCSSYGGGPREELPPPPKPPAEIGAGFVPPPALPRLREESGQALVPGATSAPRVVVPTFPVTR